MKKEQAATLKAQLQETRRQILNGVSKLLEHSNDEFESDTPDINDEASRTYNRQVLLSLGEVDRQQLKQIDEALKLIEQNNGEYGICVDCEEKIPFARLKVAPYARRCIKCKESLEEKLRTEP
jgi:DnaK suppressor protein